MHRYRRLLVFPVLLGVMLTLASFRLNTPSASAGQNMLVSQSCANPAVSVTICTDTFAQTFSAGTSIAIAIQGGSPGVTVTCNTPSGITCTVGAGNGATVVCQVTCQSGSSFVVVLPGGATQYFTMGGPGSPSVAYPAPATTSYVSSAPVGAVTVGSSTPQVNVTVQSNGCPNGGYTVVVTVTCSNYGYNGGGLCVGGSIPTNYGCTGASVIAAPYTYSYAPLYGYGGCGYGGGYGLGGYGGGYGLGGYGGCGGATLYSSGVGGCSVFVFSCGSGFNSNCGGIFGGFGSWGCNGFNGGFSGHWWGNGNGNGGNGNWWGNRTCTTGTWHWMQMGGTHCY